MFKDGLTGCSLGAVLLPFFNIAIQAASYVVSVYDVGQWWRSGGLHQVLADCI